MHRMRRAPRVNGRLVLVVLGMIFLQTCSNGTGPSGELFFRFKSNGTLVEFTGQTSLTAAFSSSGNQFNAVFTGFDALTNAGVQVFDIRAITTTTYSGYSLSGNGLVGVLLHYHDASGTLYQPDTSGPIDATATITEISDKHVRGTFSGRISAQGQADILITEGQFYLLRAN